MKEFISEEYLKMGINFPEGSNFEAFSGPAPLKLIFVHQNLMVDYEHIYILGASEITANLYCNCVYLYWKGCMICSIYLR